MVSIQDVIPIAESAAEVEATAPDAYPARAMRMLHDAGILRAPFTPGRGGSGWLPLDATRAILEIASRSPSVALIAAMPLGLAGVTELLGQTDPPPGSRWLDQVEEIARDYREGKHYAACNSEAGAGGSLAATTTTASRDAAGQWRLTGRKILASGGRHADVFFSTAKALPEELPGTGVAELFLVRTDATGVEIMEDWDGFGMRGTESQSVRYESAQAIGLWGYPNMIELTEPISYWFNLFAAIPLGCATGIFRAMSSPAPSSPAIRSRLVDAQMRLESLTAYLEQVAAEWHPAAGPAYAARNLRMKSYVSAESVRLCADLFALSGGRQYRRNSRLGRLLSDSFAGTALRPPLPLALDSLVEHFGE